ncbi:MAG: hypothetical protein K2X01_04570 [Cyanobacteria bacterium]|nr:hypothetical protein [Cyanobacteriota bacterium]
MLFFKRYSPRLSILLRPVLATVMAATAFTAASSQTLPPVQTPSNGPQNLAPMPFPNNNALGINAGSVAFIDLPESSAQSIILDINQARFAQQSVGRLTLNATGIDFKQGNLQKLKASLQDGNFNNMLVNELVLDSAPFHFDTFELLNHRRFILDKPVYAGVSLKISEANLNSFIRSPKTIGKLEAAVAKKTGGIKLIQFSNPTVDIPNGKSRVKLTMQVSLANALATPIEMSGILTVFEGKLLFQQLKVVSNQVQLPVDIATVFEKKLNELIDVERIGRSNFTIYAQSLSIHQKTIQILGNAKLSRLEFGK